MSQNGVKGKKKTLYLFELCECNASHHPNSGKENILALLLGLCTVLRAAVQ